MSFIVWTACSGVDSKDPYVPGIGTLRPSCLAKIFVTAANRAFEIGDCFQDEDKIVVPAHPSEDKTGFADKRFELDFRT
jgi:hypothetical protein